MESDRLKRMILRDEIHGECQRHLRAQELSAYSEFMNAVRMSGGIDEPKREVINAIKKWFQIPDWRHQAEIRRVASDERMELIADTISGDFTTQAWIEEGYDYAKKDTTSIIRSIVSQEDIVRQIVERRLLECGVSVDSEDDCATPTGSVGDTNAITNELLQLRQLEDCSVSAIRPEMKPEIETVQLCSHVSFASNIEMDENESSNNTGYQSTTNRNLSPDITSLSTSARRKKLSLHELKGHLSHTSKSDMERYRLKTERAKALVAKAARSKATGRGGGRKRQVLSGDFLEQDRIVREDSVASSASSCYAAIDFVKQYDVNPRPARGRGLTRVRGRSGTQISGRGRGRGRGRPPGTTDRAKQRDLETLQSQLPILNREIPSPDSSNSVNTNTTGKRAQKLKANGEVRKRPATKRKKTNPQPFPSDNLNQSPTGVLKETQQMSNETHFQQSNFTPSSEQQFLHGNNQYHDFNNHEHRFAQGQTLNPSSNSSRLQSQFPHHQYKEPPSKIRQKTKHTVIIQDPHESIPGTLTKLTPSLPEYNESKFRHSIPSTGALTSNLNSVIVRTPSYTNTPNTPPKIINPGGVPRTHINITQSPKIPLNYNSPPNKGNHTGCVDGLQHLSTSSYSTPHNSPIISNNTTYKKRTQNLAAAMTYTQQPDYCSYSSSDGNNSDVGQSPAHVVTSNISSNTGSLSFSGVATAATTASSLAVRSRPTHEVKPVGSSAVPPSTVTPPVRPLSGISNSSAPVVHQRKAQPHILATSKLHRTMAMAASAAASPPSNPGNTTPVSLPPPSTNSVIQNLASVGSSLPPALQTPNATTTNFMTAASSGVKPILPPPNSSTSTSMGISRAPGTNIIFVQKNSAATLPGQVISTPAIQSSGGMVKGPGKAVILRRANNSNLMILEVQKSQGLNTTAASQLLHNQRLVNASQTVSLSGTPIRKIIQTTGRMLTPPTAMPKSSQHSVIPPRAARVLSAQTATSVAISLGASSHTNVLTMASQIMLNQNQAIMAIRPGGTPLLSRMNTSTTQPLPSLQASSQSHQSNIPDNPLEVPGNVICETESEANKGSPVLNNSNNSSTDTASEEDDLSTSLLSNEVLENSPPPSADRDDDIAERIEVKPEPHNPVHSLKTKISVVSDKTKTLHLGPGDYYLPGRSSIPKSLATGTNDSNKEIAAKMTVAEQQSYEDGDDDEYEEEDENRTCGLANSSYSQSQSSGDQYDENEDFVEEEEDEAEFDSNGEDEAIELIDLADDDPSLSAQTLPLIKSAPPTTPIPNCRDSEITGIFTSADTQKMAEKTTVHSAEYYTAPAAITEMELGDQVSISTNEMVRS